MIIKIYIIHVFYCFTINPQKIMSPCNIHVFKYKHHTEKAKFSNLRKARTPVKTGEVGLELALGA